MSAAQSQLQRPVWAEHCQRLNMMGLRKEIERAQSPQGPAMPHEARKGAGPRVCLAANQENFFRAEALQDLHDGAQFFGEAFPRRIKHHSDRRRGFFELRLLAAEPGENF